MKKNILFVVLFAIFVSLTSLSNAMEFSDVLATPNTTSAIITWGTDVNCSSQVLYGKTTAYGSLLTNSTKSFSHYAKLPNLASGTNYYFKLKCKVNSTTTYNSSEYSFSTISTYPDLEITDGDITHTFQKSGTTTKTLLKIYVSNKGNAKALNVWVKVEGANAVLYKKIPSIAANGRAYTTVTFNSTTGKYAVTADYNNSISESNEGNNVAQHGISESESLPDLFVNQSKITFAPSAPKTGSSISISAIIKNNGAGTVQSAKVMFIKVREVKTYGEEKETDLKQGIGTNLIIEGMFKEDQLMKEDVGVKIDGDTIGEVTVGPITPGSTKTAKISYRIPADTDDFSLAVYADPENQISELSESNNIGIKTIPVDLLYPDLSINGSGITYPPDSKPGDKMKVFATIKNFGTLGVKNATVRFFVSVDGKNFAPIATVYSPSIPSKGSTRVSADYTVPTNAITALFLVDVNNDRKYSETNYSNNNASRGMEISLPDIELSGTDISITGSVEVGKNVTIKANVSNIGSASASSFPVSFYYALSNGSMKLIGSKNMTLTKGGKAQASMQWVVPTGISQNQVISVKANPEQTIFESDFSNNEGTFSASAKLPDLFARSYAPMNPFIIPGPGYYASYYNVPIQMAVKNWGNGDAKNVLVQVEDLRDHRLTNYTFANVPAGAIINFTHPYRVYKNDSPGTLMYALTTVVDPLNAITELGETNNQWPETFFFVENQEPHAVADTNPPRCGTFSKCVLKNEWITFNCENSTDPENPGRQTYWCDWDFGDGSEPESGHEVYHYYPQSGEYEVRLNVTDVNGGVDDSAYVAVTVAQNQPPVANSGGVYTAYTNEPVYLDPSASYDPDGSIISVDWEFGDGGTAYGESLEPIAHTYTSPGTYWFEHMVHDNDGATSGWYRNEVYVVNPPPTSTKTGTEYYVSHHYTVEAGPTADMWYGIYKIDYELKYTQTDHVIKSLKYTITSGPAIVTAVTDNDAESLYMDMTAVAANGKTAMQVRGVEIRDGYGTVLWSESGGPHVSGSESPRSMTYSGIEAQPGVWNDQNYIVINSEITYPGQMCTAEQFNCQQQAATWIFP